MGPSLGDRPKKTSIMSMGTTRVTPSAPVTLAPLSLTTRSYLARSRFMKSSNCSGVLGAGSAIRLPKRVLTSGDFKASTNAVLSFWTTSRGVPAGATILPLGLVAGHGAGGERLGSGRVVGCIDDHGGTAAHDLESPG